MSADKLKAASAKLAELRAERPTIASTPTREGVRALAESWVAAASLPDEPERLTEHGVELASIR